MVPHVKVDTSFKDGGRELSDAEYRVYVHMGLYVDKGGLCYPKIHTIAVGCAKSDRAVQMAIRRLCSLGLVDIVQRGGRRPKDPNVYRINRYISFGPNTNAPIDNDKGEGGCTLKEAKGETTCTHRVKGAAPIGVKSPHDRREPYKEEPYKASTTIETGSFIKLLQTLQSLLNWKPDDRDQKWLEEFLQEFPLTVNDIKGCGEWYSEKPGGVDRGVWQNRLRHWMSRKGKDDGGRKSAKARRGSREDRQDEEVDWGIGKPLR